MKYIESDIFLKRQVCVVESDNMLYAQCRHGKTRDIPPMYTIYLEVATGKKSNHQVANNVCVSRVSV